MQSLARAENKATLSSPISMRSRWLLSRSVIQNHPDPNTRTYASFLVVHGEYAVRWYGRRECHSHGDEGRKTISTGPLRSTRVDPNYLEINEKVLAQTA